MRVTAVSGPLTIRATAPEPALPDALAKEVDAVWSAIRRGNPHVVDGILFSATDVSSERIEGRFVPYRRWAAQMARPALAPRLAVRPLGVSGLLLCADGVVIGRRSQHVGHPGLWELAPSGGISRDPPDWRDAILAELSEEVGLHREDVAAVHPFCLVEDERDGVIDIGIRIETPLTGAEIVARHGALALKEYAELFVPATAQALHWLESREPEVVAASLALLRRHLTRDPCGRATR